MVKMKEFESILSLINKGKLNEAETLLRESKEENGEYNYLVGLISFFKGNKDVALGFLFRSIEDEEINHSIKTNAKRIAAYILFSKKEYEKAIKLINDIKNKNVDDHFVLFSCYIFLNDFKKANFELETAYNLNHEKTKELLVKFYESYVKPSPEISEDEKKLFLEIINSLKGNN